MWCSNRANPATWLLQACNNNLENSTMITRIVEVGTNYVGVVGFSAEELLLYYLTDGIIHDTETSLLESYLQLIGPTKRKGNIDPFWAAYKSTWLATLPCDLLLIRVKLAITVQLEKMAAVMSPAASPQFIAPALVCCPREMRFSYLIMLLGFNGNDLFACGG